MTQQCRECGANLPEGAQSCMQCGTNVELSAKSTAKSPVTLEFLQPAIAGGLLLGALSSLPVIQGANLFFGIWMLAGGAVTTRLLLKQSPNGISYGDGAFGGVLSGFFGAIVATVVLIPDKLIFVAEWEAQRQNFEKQLQSIPEVTGPPRDLLLRAVSPEISFTTEMYWFFAYGILFSLFAMFGGMLMVWVTNRRRRAMNKART